jgi:hypothetical protein
MSAVSSAVTCSDEQAFWERLNPPEYGVSARALIPYTVGLNHCQNFTPPSEDGLKESPKHVSQK